MEDASKAMTIAGAILLIIILITIGIAIFNSSSDFYADVSQEVDSAEVQSFNNQFAKYEGRIVNASQVKSLLLLIKANNSYYNYDSSTPDGTDKYIKLIGNVKSGSLYANKTYKVSIERYNNHGYVSEIKIELNN